MYVQCRRDPPWWIIAIGTVEIPSVVHQMGLCLPKYETSTEYNSVIRTRTTQKKAWASKVGKPPCSSKPVVFFFALPPLDQALRASPPRQITVG